MRACKCPNCGSNLNFDEIDREYVFCQYCGAKIDLMDQRSIHTEHIVDDARIKNADSIHRVVDIFASPFEERKRKKQEEAARQKQAEEEAKKRQEEASEAFGELMGGLGIAFAALVHQIQKHPKHTLIAFVLIIAICAAHSSVHAANTRKAAEEADRIASSHIAMGEVQYPEEARSSGDYRNLYKELRDAGFTNITLVPAGDLIIGYFNSENDIIEITVDGAPAFNKGEWYPSDIPIVISYHSYTKEVSSSSQNNNTTVTQKNQESIAAAKSTAQEKVQSAKDAASKVTDDTVSQIAPESTSISADTLSAASEAAKIPYDACYIIRLDNYSEYYAIHYDSNTVRHFTTKSNSSIQIGKIIKGSLKTGMTVRFSEDSSRDIVMTSDSERDKSIIVTYPDNSNVNFVKTSTSAVHTVLLSNLHDGWTGSRSVSSSSTTYKPEVASSVSVSSVSKPEPSVHYTPSHKNTIYDEAYCLRNSQYANYYLISYQDKIVRSFAYGNGSKEAYVGHITGGSKTKGLTVHYNYENGWDETIRIDGIYMILTDPDGATFTFTLSPLSPVRDIYKSNNYKDIPET